MKRDPVEWVVFSWGLLLFGVLFGVGGATEVVGGLADAANGSKATGVVQSCNDLRAAKCEVRVVQPPTRVGVVSVEPISQLEVGSRVQLLFMPDGRVEAETTAIWFWRWTMLVGGILLAWLGGWRLLSGLGDPNR